jgi:hypothetical protein
MADAARPRSRETMLLAALAVSLLGLAVWQVAVEGEDELLGVAMPVRPPAVVTAGSGDAAGAGPDTAVILDRPLFSEARRRVVPIATAQAAPPPPAPPPPEPPLSARYELIGLSRAEGAVVALIREKGGEAKVRQLRSGEQLQGWALADMEQRRAVVFARGDRRQALTLPSVARPQTPQQAAAAAQARAQAARQATQRDDDDEDDD